jgi:hypothetical protein
LKSHKKVAILNYINEYKIFTAAVSAVVAANLYCLSFAMAPAAATPAVVVAAFVATIAPATCSGADSEG